MALVGGEIRNPRVEPAQTDDLSLTISEVTSGKQAQALPNNPGRAPAKMLGESP